MSPCSRLAAASLASLLLACAGDSSDETAGASSSGSDASSGDETSTTAATATSDSATTSTSAETTAAETTAAETTGPAIGCTPGDPCCNDAGEFEDCFIDEVTGLAWELDPQGGNPNLPGAQTYCDQLSLLGAGGWRVPTVDELRTLVTGCPDTEADGACGQNEACPTPDCRDDACDGCIDAAYQGPAAGGCYWNPNLVGECGRYWANTDPGGGLGLIVDFSDATLRQADASLPAALVRCVASLE